MLPCQPAFSRRNLLTVCSVVAAVSLGVTASHQTQGDERGETQEILRSVTTLRERGEYSKAIATAKAAVALAEKTVGPDAPQTTAAKKALGSAYLEVGDRAAAEPLLRDTLASVERAQPQDMRAVCNVVGDLAQAVANQAETESLHRRALAIAEEDYGPEHPATAMALNNIGAWYREQARPEEAEPLMRRALRIRERTEGTGSPLAAQSLCLLGMIAADRGEMSLAEALREFAQHLVEAGKPRQAIEFCRRAILAWMQDNPETQPLDAAAIRHSLAKYLLAVGEMEEARRLLREAVVMFEQTTGQGSRQTLNAMYLLAFTYLVTDDLGEAERLLDDGLQRFAAADDGRSGDVATTFIALLGKIYRSTGRIDKAEKAEAAFRQARAGPSR
jgi:Tfp pilus assembly protein PilF